MSNEAPTMKEFYIVKKALKNGLVGDCANKVYTKKQAFDRARELAEIGRERFVVFKAVVAFQSVAVTQKVTVISDFIHGE